MRELAGWPLRGCSLYLSLRRLSRVEDELSEISLINQVLEVSSEDSALDGRVTHPVVEGVVLLRS